MVHPAGEREHGESCRAITTMTTSTTMPPWTVGGYGLLADFFPMKGTFRLTAGLLSNRNKVELDAVPTGDTIDIGGINPTRTRSGRNVLSGDIDFDSSVPYFGIGWGNVARGKRVRFPLRSRVHPSRRGAKSA